MNTYTTSFRIRSRLMSLPRYVLPVSTFFLFALQSFGQDAQSGQKKPEETKVSVESVKDTAEPADEPLVLSPFEVSANRDVGFAPTSALTGGRMALKLTDTAMAYSSLTREFIDAMGISDINSASQWATNSVKILDPAGGGDTFGLTSLGQQRGANASGNRMVNFFPYYAPNDTYNLDRVDFARGPNAVMFGNGTLGGTQVALTKRAEFSRAFRRVDATAGSYGFYRTAVDLNQPINKYFAARLNILYQKADGWRDFAQDNNQAISPTISFKPTSKTTVRLEGERGQQKRQIPLLALGDQFLGWNGTTTFNGSTGLGTGAAVTSSTGPSAVTTSSGSTVLNPLGIGTRGSNYYVYAPSSGLGNTVLEYQNDPMTLGAGGSTTTPYGPYVQVGTNGLGTAGGPLLFGELMDLPGNRFDAINASPYAHYATPSQRFVNSVRGPINTTYYSNAQLTIQHSFSDNFSIELAAIDADAKGEVNRLATGSLASATYIDINRVLPDGSQNPNFGRPYGDNTYTKNMTDRVTKAWRLGAAYLKDFGKWGNYGFNVMGGSTQQRFRNGPGIAWSLGVNPDHRRWQDLDVIRVRSYWGDSISADVPTGAYTFKDNNYTQNGVTNSVMNTTIQPRWVTQPTGATNSFTKYNYALTGMNASFFEKKLIVTGALRRDNFNQLVRQSVRIGDYPADWDGRSVIWRPDAPADWANLTYQPYNSLGVRGGAIPAVNRPTSSTQSLANVVSNGLLVTGPNPSGVALRDLRYEGDRFQDDYNSPALKSGKTNWAFGGLYHVLPWWSIGYNSATSYSVPASTTPAVDGSILPPTEAKGYDIITRFTAFKGRLSINYTYYQDKEINAYVSAGTGVGQVNTNGNINGIYGANVIGDDSSTGRNLRGGSDVLAAANDIRGRHNQGHEIEIVGNISAGWRINASISKNRLENVNSYPMSLKYIADHTELFKQILLDTGATLDPTPVAPGAPGTAVVNNFYYTTAAAAAAAGFPGRFSIDQASAVSNFNSLYSNAANYQKDTVISLDNYVINAYSDYAIQTGMFKRLRFGLGYQYRGRLVAGYRGADTIATGPTTFADDPTVNAYTPVYTPSWDVWTGTLGYTWKPRKGLELNFTLRIDNLLGQTRPVWSDAIAMRPLNGDYNSPARESVASRLGEYRQPRSYTLMTNVKF
ncbi:MAG: hypothetical protein QM715_08135 [Nibricoccus sp.]